MVLAFPVPSAAAVASVTAKDVGPSPLFLERDGLILPPINTPSRKILDKVVALLQARGHRVTTVPTEQFA